MDSRPVRCAALATPSANRNAWSTARSPSSSPPPASSLTADNETQSGTEVRLERRISHPFLIPPVGSVLHVGVGGDVTSDGVPTTEVDARIAGGVVDAEAEEIGI